MAIADMVSFFLVTLFQLAPVASAFLAGAFMSIVVLAVIVLARAPTPKPDACALGIIFFPIPLLLSAEKLAAIRYVFPFCGLLYVFLGWVIVDFVARLRSEDASAWGRWGAAVATLVLVIFLASDVAFALENGSVPKSGIRSFVAAQRLDPANLYVIAPDYLAPTFAFYARHTNVRFLGFARIYKPEMYTLGGYSSIWRDPAAVGKALKVIAREANHYAFLDLLVDESAKDEYRFPFGKTWQLLHELRRRYPMVAHTRYPGRCEPLSVYRFALH